MGASRDEDGATPIDVLLFLSTALEQFPRDSLASDTSGMLAALVRAVGDIQHEMVRGSARVLCLDRGLGDSVCVCVCVKGGFGAAVLFVQPGWVGVVPRKRMGSGGCCGRGEYAMHAREGGWVGQEPRDLPHGT